MKTGIEQIAEERQEQIEKHKFDIAHDRVYTHGELSKAAMFCLTRKEKYYPKHWGTWLMENICDKKLRMTKVEFKIEMNRIAGALLAASIDVLQQHSSDVINEIFNEGDRAYGKWAGDDGTKHYQKGVVIKKDDCLYLDDGDKITEITKFIYLYKEADPVKPPHDPNWPKPFA